MGHFEQLLPKVLPADVWEKCQENHKQLQNEGLSEEIAGRYAALKFMTDFLPLVGMVENSGKTLEQLAQIKLLVEAKVDSAGIAEVLNKVTVLDSWDRRARESLISSLHAVNIRIVEHVAMECADKPQDFFARRRQKMRTFENLRKTLVTEVPRNFHPFTVLLRSLESLLTA